MTAARASNPAVVACVFAAYFGLSKVGLMLGGLNGPVAAIWPPSGFALAATIFLGRQVWPAVLGGAFIAYAAATGQLAASAVMAIGNTVEALVGGLLVDRLARGPRAFDGAATVFRFSAIAALVSTAGAMGGAAGSMIANLSPFGDSGYAAMTWWLMDFSGILVVAPFVVLWVVSSGTRRRFVDRVEAVVLASLLGLVGVVVFAGKFPSDVKDYPLEFLCLPFLLWAAFRFERRMMATVIVILSGVAVWGTLHGFGPFVRFSRNEAVLLVQAYISLTAIMGLVLAATVAEHRSAERQLRELATTDPLTGLANYRRLIEVAKIEIARSARTGRSFALLLVDMNGLKRINDRHGHLVGSRAICRVADALRQTCRTIDTVARFGGDEFAVVLPESGEPGGRAVLGRLADRLARDDDKPALSVSGGVAVYPADGDTVTQLVRAADARLYEAKARPAAARKIASPEARKTGTLF